MISGGTPRRVDKAHKRLFASCTVYRYGVFVAFFRIFLARLIFGLALTFLCSFGTLDIKDGDQKWKTISFEDECTLPMRDCGGREERGNIVNK